MREARADRLVTIARYASVADADLAKAILAMNGIVATLRDVHMRLIHPYVVREVRLQVRAAEAPKALDILRAGSDEHKTLRNGLAQLLQCPNCASYDLGRSALPLVVAVVSWVLFGIPLLFIKRHWHCNACGYSWKG